MSFLFLLALPLSLVAAGCSLTPAVEDALSVGSDETSSTSRGPGYPDLPEGVAFFAAYWYEDPDVTAADINDQIMKAITAAGGQVSCNELPPRETTPTVPVQDCSFIWTDGREGTYTVDGGGPPSEEMDTDGVAIALNAQYPES